MPITGSEFGLQGYEKVQCQFEKTMKFGLPGLYEANLQGGTGSGPGGGIYQLLDGCDFFAGTGTGWLADITPTQAAAVVLVPASRCPTGLRPYITAAQVSVNGNIAWSNTSPSGIPYISIQGTDGTPLIHIPFSAAKAGVCFAFPDSASPFPLLLGETAKTNSVATFTYSATAKTITASASVFVASKLIGTPVMIMDGTGKGSTAIITANTATVLTLGAAFQTAPADHASSAKDSVIGVFYQNLGTYTDTTHVTIENGGGTPFAANATDSLNLIGVAGAGVGQSRLIIASSTAGAQTLNGALNTAMDTTTSAVALNSNPTRGGAIDMSAYNLASAAPNTGIQVAVANLAGTTPVGSPVRVLLAGFWGP